MNQIILAGNPNVGKSVVFNRLTGVRVISSNYPGTTVEFTKGHIHIGGEHVDIIDVPGTYSLNPSSPAEEVATKMLIEESRDENNVLVIVVDATNLERNLLLTLQLLNLGMRTVLCLNVWDETVHNGIKIDVQKLEEILGVPVVTTTAISGEGIKELVDTIPDSRVSGFVYKEEEKWNQIGSIISEVQRVTHRHHSFKDRFQEFTIHPLSGLPIALVILLICFEVVRFIGEGLIEFVFNPIFDVLWLSLIHISEPTRPY